MFKRLRSDWFVMSPVRRVVLVILLSVLVLTFGLTAYEWTGYFRERAQYKQYMKQYFEQYEGMSPDEIRREILRQQGAIHV